MSTVGQSTLVSTLSNHKERIERQCFEGNPSLPETAGHIAAWEAWRVLRLVLFNHFQVEGQVADRASEFLAGTSLGTLTVGDMVGPLGQLSLNWRFLRRLGIGLLAKVALDSI